MKYVYVIFIIGITIALARMTSDVEDGEELLGGTGTVFIANNSSGAFSFPNPNLNDEQGLDFFTGNSLFNQSWVTAGASTTARDGLGPMFNARSCSSCHLKDGRGRPPKVNGERGHGLLIRMATGNDEQNGAIADKNYGTQLQDQAIQGMEAEADFKISYDTLRGKYPDGTSYTLLHPQYEIIDLQEGEITATEFSPRVANQIIGMGLLEAIDEATLLELADEADEDGDGISGRPNYVWNVETQSNTIGRFGWKANQPNLKQQVASALAGDMGITSSLFPNENCPPSVNCDELPNGGTPEISDKNLEKMTLYASSLAVPARRNWDDRDVLKGKALFETANCTSCHTPKITTGQHPIFEAFSEETIRPYTDLLLHDMGEGLADGAGDYLATGKEWRTPPLWGIGLFKIVNEHTNYLHDGRARNLEEAILWHGGEAEASKDAFMNMSKKERTQLIKFLESL
ncbi:MAG: di-heme oxidoredictase family protein [Bacteroidota bacterium]